MSEYSEIFVSTTSDDLRTIRRAICDELLKIDYHPISMDTFGTGFGELHELLDAKIARCDAVIHVVGIRYGAEPKDAPAGTPRRSYTQMEYDTARRLKKPLIVYICGPNFPYDPHTPESAELVALQDAHRNSVANAGKQIRYKVDNHARLLEGIMRLRINQEVSNATKAVGAEANTRLAAWIMIGVAVAAALVAWSLLGTQNGSHNPLTP